MAGDLPRGGPARLAHQGHGLLTYAEAILDQLHAARQALSDLRELKAGRLRIGAFDSGHGEIDVAVVSAYPHQPLDSTELDLHDRLEDRCWWRCQPATGSPVPARRGWPSWPGSAGSRASPRSAEALTEACLRSGFRPRIDLEVREWTAKQGFVAAGLGLALVPLIAVAAVRPDITLRRPHPDDAPVRTARFSRGQIGR